MLRLGPKSQRSQMSKLAEIDLSTFSENTSITKAKNLLLKMCTLDAVITRKLMH